MTKDQRQVLEVFQNGGIVIYPTDTAFGIGCRIDDQQAVARLFTLKKRDPDKAVPILAADTSMAVSFWQKPLPKVVDELVGAHWPGALTVIYYAAKTEYQSSLYGPGKTFGLRVPDHSELREIIASLGVPVIGTSANFAGERTPHAVSEIDPNLSKQADFVMNGQVVGGASTVVDCTNGIKVVRQGNVEVRI